jgi:hypothetical protein
MELGVCICTPRSWDPSNLIREKRYMEDFRTVPALIYTLVSQWLIRLPIAYILAFPLGYDTTGLWITLVIFSALQGILTARKFLKGEWKTRRV